ncbi:sphingomyelin phosphodiesterase 1 isoform X1 [Bombus terrestris]|uniref:Sphingomyelin phosphodiesterase n=2 Tax=Bombus terrestris TaxID=30195 RepID=A0A9C6WES5_BOMTE|nr:sphingomyelin phosphodiesterase 1 isoform X1 [Bombus terrestris]XP_048269701.1 sphingomyelin phosphodiesterase 1 isoform X1 [Bombus terrestris]
MWFQQLILSILVLSINGLVRHPEDIDVNSFSNEIELWTKLDYEGELFNDMIKSLKIPTELQNSDWRSFTANSDTKICTICRGILKTFFNLRRKGMSEEDIKDKIVKLCVLFNIQTERVCRGVVELNLPIVLYIVDSKSNLTANTVCGVVLESKSCPLSDPEFDWNIHIDNNSNAIITDNETQKQIKILQITDLHYDPLYEPYGNSICREPVCCRKGQNEPNMTQFAGFWGDYNSCDTPWHAITDALNHIKDTHQDIDFIYFTGDIIDHGVWETSKEGNVQSLVKIYEYIHDTFNDTIIYPIFGNHESNPLNQFAPKNITQDNLTTNWLYKLMADLWIVYGWLPEHTRSTILQGGYYTVVPKRGFRIIALNSNVCYSYNWWLWYNPQDPDNQLHWLATILSEAERNDEFVHVLSHIPSNSNSCFKTWKREYLRIIDRFSHIIKAEFNGHTHNDEIAIFYNSDMKAKNVAWNGGSITAYSKLNPNYKIYIVNCSNYEVADYQNWMYDLSSANKNIHVRPTWYKSYSFKTEYDLPDLSVKSLNNWLSTAAKNETLLNKYYKNFYKHAGPKLQEPCDINCKKQYLCRIIVHSETELCNNILKN